MFDTVKIGFIGFGNMASALATGWIGKQVIQPKQIYACAKNWEKLCEKVKETGIQPCKNAMEVTDNVDIVVIAVKPYMVEEVITPIREKLKDKIVVSVVAGYPFERYERVLEKGTAHISTIPNTPVSIGEGILVCEERHSLTEQQWNLVKQLFSTIALVQLVDTKLLSVAGTICGCGPAFVSMFLEALGDAGVKYGIPREIAYELTAQMIAGTGKLQSATKTHPAAMKDAVCSPGGTTIRGVSALEKNGFRSAVIQAIDAIEGTGK